MRNICATLLHLWDSALKISPEFLCLESDKTNPRNGVSLKKKFMPKIHALSKENAAQNTCVHDGRFSVQKFQRNAIVLLKKVRRIFNEKKKNCI